MFDISRIKSQTDKRRNYNLTIGYEEEHSKKLTRKLFWKKNQIFIHQQQKKRTNKKKSRKTNFWTVKLFCQKLLFPKFIQLSIIKRMDIQLTKSKLIKQKNKDSTVTFSNLDKPILQYGQPNVNSNSNFNLPPLLPSVSKKSGNPGTPTSSNQNNQQNSNNIINQNLSFNPNDSHMQNSKANKSEFSEQAESSLKKENMKEISQFASAWKLQTGFNIIAIQTVLDIVRIYFKMRPELSKRIEEIEILVVYNKALLEILSKFEDHEKKIIHKLHVMEEFNVKIMRELCSLKNKQFKAPQLKLEESIFSKFSLKNFQYQPEPNIQYKLNEHDRLKTFQIFKQHLLLPLTGIQPKIQEKIKQFQSREKSLLMEDNIQDLQELKKKIYLYNDKIKDFNHQNMFDLYQLKLNIKKQFDELQLEDYYLSDQAGEQEKKLFVQEVMKIQASLENKQEKELIDFLKKEVENRKRLRKKRIKEQQVFMRMCEKVESQNIEHVKDISAQKHKINSLEDELNRIKAHNDFKMMKIKSSSNRSMLMSDGMNQSMLEDDGKNDLRVNKKMLKETITSMQKEINRLKQQNQTSIEALTEYKSREHNKKNSLKGIREQAKNKNIIIDETWQEVKILHFLIQKLAEFATEGQIILAEGQNNQFLNLNNNGNINNLNDLPKSPSMKSAQGFTSVSLQIQNKFLNTIKQTQNEDGELQNQMRNKEIQKFQKEAEELQRKNQESKKLIQKLNSSLKQLETDIKKKNSKINQLVKQYQKFQVLIKQLRIQNQSLKLKYYCSESLNQKMIHLIEKIQREDLKSDKDVRIIDSLFAKFHQLIEQYNNQIQSSQKQYQINRQINIQMDGGFRDENSLNNKNNGDDNVSVASLKIGNHKKKEKRESDLLSVKDYREEDSKDSKVLKQSVLRKIKSYNSLNIQNELQKQLQIERKALSPKRLGIRAKHELEKSPDISQSLHQNENLIKKMLTEKKSQTQVGYLQIDKKISLATEPKIIIKSQKNNTSKQKQEEKSASSLGQKIKNPVKNQNEKEEIAPKQMQNILQFLNIKEQDKKQQNMKQKPFGKQSPKVNQENKNNKSKIQQPSQKEPKVKITQSQKNDKQKAQQSELKRKLKRKMEKMEQEYLQNEKKSKLKPQQTPEKQKKQEKKQEKPISSEQKQSSSESKRQMTQKKEEAEVNSKKTIKKQIQKLFLDELDLKDEQKGDKNKLKSPIVAIEENSDKNQLQVSQEKQLQLLISQRQSSNLQSSNRININVNFADRNNEIENVNLTYSSKNTQMHQLASNINIKNETDQSSRQKESTSKKENKLNLSEKGIKKKVGHHENSLKNLDKHLKDTYGIHLQNHEKIMDNIKKLSDYQDALDFAQLYARYKQAVKCLDMAQETNRMYEINYQNFKAQLEQKQKTENYNQEKQLFYLRTLVEQQQKRIQEDDMKFNESLRMHIKTSQELINLQLKNLRQEYKKNNKPETRVIFF